MTGEIHPQRADIALLSQLGTSSRARLNPRILLRRHYFMLYWLTEGTQGYILKRLDTGLLASSF
jgi:hypothetical protein